MSWAQILLEGLHASKHQLVSFLVTSAKFQHSLKQNEIKSENELPSDLNVLNFSLS